jgi:hypothetical protein
MSKGATFTYDFARLVYQAVAIPNIADNAASSPNTQIIVGLHFADPGEGGNQSTSEAVYSGYSRAAVPRTSGGWTVAGVASGTQISNTAQVQWPANTDVGSVATAAYWSTAVSTGASKILHSGKIATPLAVTIGVQPIAAAGALTILED